MSNHYTPLAVCEALIGPLDQLAAITLQTPKAPFVWRRASKTRDAGDIPSARHMRRLLSYSDEHGLGLTPAHLIFGASQAEIDKILQSRSPQVAA